jgi:hypothetical protein
MRLARSLSMLPPAPESWVRVAQELAPALARAKVDDVFRADLLADPEATLSAEGFELSPELIPELRLRLER